MAAAEARTAWQRTANRCYVHEDAREKYSCGPSSSYSSKSESDHAPDNAAKEPHNIILDYLQPFPSSDVLTGRRWWLNQEPNFGHHKNFTSEEPMTWSELEIFSSEFCEENQPKEEFITKTGMKQLGIVSATCIENGEDTRMQGLKAVTCNSPQKNATGKDVRDFWYLDDHLMNLDSLNCLVSQDPKKLSFDYESHWLGADKTGPWWRSAGKDDLASLVAQKSLYHIENCDLPRPRAKTYRKHSSACSQNFDHDDILPSTLDRMAESRFSGLDYASGSPDSGCLPHDSKQTCGSNSNHSTTNINKQDAQDSSKNDQSKAQLLKALCLSQKRAREAEKAAKQAYNEKEHIITLLFRQASQLFAYKQWLQLLQLENICLQLKNKSQPIGNIFPSVLPWAPSTQVKKGQHRGGKKRQGKPKHEINKSVVAFALGIGLASAGLLLGWTMGWLFPTI
ncbi:hypothetical protein PanWU01x14_068820 [Parasponia andersonii]|uniref:Transmembrane protein n=1 Tax=Parasponia andersonii TaxID=3476 RepID=A0A2P5DFL3_PARAD|nr:hypothetical protein PanWU01x14_068820 [Parasponia andersonii]